MKTKSIFISAVIALAAITALSAKDNPKAASYKSYETKDKSAPAVYFIRDISPEALVKVYNATGYNIEICMFNRGSK